MYKCYGPFLWCAAIFKADKSQNLRKQWFHMIADGTKVSNTWFPDFSSNEDLNQTQRTKALMPHQSALGNFRSQRNLIDFAT